MVPIVPGRRRGWVPDFSRTGGAHRGQIWTVVVRRRKLMARQVSATAILVSLSVLVALGMMAQPHWVTPGTTLFIVLLGVFGLKLPGMIVLSMALLAQVIGLE